jgi:hypothetical protein
LGTFDWSCFSSLCIPVIIRTLVEVCYRESLTRFLTKCVAQIPDSQLVLTLKGCVIRFLFIFYVLRPMGNDHVNRVPIIILKIVEFAGIFSILNAYYQRPMLRWRTWVNGSKSSKLRIFESTRFLHSCRCHSVTSKTSAACRNRKKSG